MKHIYTLKNTNSFGSWALTIVNRKAIDWIRKEKNTDEKLHQFYENSKANDDTKENCNGIDNDPAIVADNRTKVIINAIKKLPNNQQIIIRMFYLEEYTIQEIGVILEVSKGTVKSRLFYAREKLKLTLKRIKNEK